jgi:hypothetical protein
MHGRVADERDWYCMGIKQLLMNTIYAYLDFAKHTSFGPIHYNEN